MLDVKVIARFQIISLWDGLHTISAIENSGVEDEKIKTWIAWAKQKADWLDPIIARKDEYLGKREHEKDEDAKKLKNPILLGDGELVIK